MDSTAMPATPRSDLETPTRNNYFYGKLLDTYHFELETAYFNRQRRRLNRHISGTGVVCGLNVEVGKDPDQIVITPGLAIDQWGREIVVARPTDPIAIPPEVMQEAWNNAGDCRDDAYVLVLICFHQCLSDPVPVLAGDCQTAEPCAPGSVREQYRIAFQAERAPARKQQRRAKDLVAGGRLDYAALAKWVSKGCRELPSTSCIPLASIHLLSEEEGYGRDPDRIDIAVRPIVYTNRVLLEIILALLSAESEDADDQY